MFGGIRPATPRPCLRFYVDLWGPRLTPRPNKNTVDAFWAHQGPGVVIAWREKKGLRWGATRESGKTTKALTKATPKNTDKYDQIAHFFIFIFFFGGGGGTESGWWQTDVLGFLICGGRRDQLL